MRHLKAGRKFGRPTAHRKAMFRNMVTALIQQERIRTTLPKAKELRSKVEKTITLGKKGTLHARRLAVRTVPQKEALQKLFGPLAERFANRNGGYTRIIRIGNRRGDDAPMAFIELIGEEGKQKKSAADDKKKTKEASPTAKKTETKKTEAKKPAEKKTEKKKAAKEEDKKE
jgi:large subunit ribosomal protein L17